MNNDSKETNVKKIIALATVVVALAIPATSLAASSDSNASYNGEAHAARADVNENFGWLGNSDDVPGNGAPDYHGGMVGQDPGATGYNNSQVNPNGNPTP